jgi:hypothetical protein
MAAEPQNRPGSAAELGAALGQLGQRVASRHSGGLAPRFAQPVAHRLAPQVRRQSVSPGPVSASPPAAAPGPFASIASITPPVSTRRLLLVLGSALGVLLGGFTALGLSPHTARAGRPPPGTLAASAPPAAAAYTPQDVVVALGPDRSELIVSWAMPVRPEVIATVVYEGARARPRAVVTYGNGRAAAARVTLRGLRSGERVCVSAAHLVSRGDVVSGAASAPVCAVPR